MNAQNTNWGILIATITQLAEALALIPVEVIEEEEVEEEDVLTPSEIDALNEQLATIDIEIVALDLAHEALQSLRDDNRDEWRRVIEETGVTNDEIETLTSEKPSGWTSRLTILIVRRARLALEKDQLIDELGIIDADIEANSNRKSILLNEIITIESQLP